jgi:hypothetical protein
MSRPCRGPAALPRHLTGRPGLLRSALVLPQLAALGAIAVLTGALAGCEIAAFDVSPVVGSATTVIDDRTTNYATTGGRDPRDIGLACERLGVQVDDVDVVHISISDQLAQTGRVAGADMVLRILVVDGFPTVLNGFLSVWDGEGYYQANLLGGRTQSQCEGALGNYRTESGDIVWDIRCPDSDDGTENPGPPIGFSGELHQCALAVP